MFGRGGLDQWAYAVFEFDDALAGEGLHGGVSPGALQISQRVGGQIVISLIEMVAAGVGDDEDLGRSATPPCPADALFTRFDDAIGKKKVEVSAHCGRGEPESPGKVDRRGRALSHDRIGDLFTGRRTVDRGRLLDPHVFHYTSVPLIIRGFNKGMPKSSTRPEICAHTAIILEKTGHLRTNLGR